MLSKKALQMIKINNINTPTKSFYYFRSIPARAKNYFRYRSVYIIDFTFLLILILENYNRFKVCVYF